MHEKMLVMQHITHVSEIVHQGRDSFDVQCSGHCKTESRQSCAQQKISGLFYWISLADCQGADVQHTANCPE